MSLFRIGPKIQSDEDYEHWYMYAWRPTMAWLYAIICTFDFVVFPILNALFHAYEHITPLVQWVPLTLQGGGLFHLAFGAILGIYAYGRTMEKRLYMQLSSDASESPPPQPEQIHQ
jgi:hypothetical protein